MLGAPVPRHHGPGCSPREASAGALVHPCPRERGACGPLPFLQRHSPPLSLVLTDWLSMTAAVGLALRPELARSAITRAWFTRSNSPSSRPVGKPAIDGPPRRKVGRQKAPRAARPHHVEDGVD